MRRSVSSSYTPGGHRASQYPVRAPVGPARPQDICGSSLRILRSLQCNLRGPVAGSGFLPLLAGLVLMGVAFGIAAGPASSRIIETAPVARRRPGLPLW